MGSKYAIGQRVSLTERGAEYGIGGDCECFVNTVACHGEGDCSCKDECGFFVAHATGTVVDVRDGIIRKGEQLYEYLVRYDGDTVEDRAWWMMSDEVTAYDKA